MCDPISATIAGGAILGAGSSYAQGKAQKKAAKRANAQAEARAAEDAANQTRQFNKANQKTPNIAALMDANQDAVGGGMGSTFLTGPQGVDFSQLKLGQATLLGG